MFAIRRKSDGHWFLKWSRVDGKWIPEFLPGQGRFFMGNAPTNAAEELDLICECEVVNLRAERQNNEAKT